MKLTLGLHTPLPLFAQPGRPGFEAHSVSVCGPYLATEKPGRRAADFATWSIGMVITTCGAGGEGGGDEAVGRGAVPRSPR